ncbi:MAG TPA: hypothetical protein VMB66_07125 [Candidatus Acidoferrales bacterium]|nr:hypothetical protein [Candidatus Acidoferrales bacterium]
MRCWLVIIVCLGGVLQSPKTHTDKQQNSQTNINKSAIDQKAADAGKALSQTQINTNNYQNPEGNETVKNITDGLLALFTLALAVVSVMQWRVLQGHEQWMEKHDAKLEQLAEAANKNADAARMNAETAEKSLRLAYAASLGIVPFISAGKIIVELKNYGRTVAHNVTLVGDIADVVDGGKATPFRVEPLIVPTDAVTRAEIGKTLMKQDSYGQPHLLHDLRCNLNVIYEDIFTDTHIRSYVLLFNRDTLTVTVEKESS